MNANEAVRQDAKHVHLHMHRHDSEKDYRHDHSLFTRSQLLDHLNAQHQPRVLPTIRYDGTRGYLDLNARFEDKP